MKATIAIKSIIAATAMAAGTLPALATVRLNTQSHTCEAVRSTLDRNGAAILRYSSRLKPHLTLYGRYVADARFCVFGEQTKRASVPTIDKQSCQVLSCFRPEREDRRILRGR